MVSVERDKAVGRIGDWTVKEEWLKRPNIVTGGISVAREETAKRHRDGRVEKNTPLFACGVSCENLQATVQAQLDGMTEAALEFGTFYPIVGFHYEFAVAGLPLAQRPFETLNSPCW